MTPSQCIKGWKYGEIVENVEKNLIEMSREIKMHS